jgi:hypothetical protein
MRTSLAKPLAIAAVGALVGLIVNSAASFFTNWTNAAPWFAAPFIAVAVAVAQASVSAVGERGAEPVYPPSAGHSVRVYRSGTSLPVVVAAILALGALALVATAGVRYAVGWYTGNERGSERLAQIADGGSEGLGITVSSLEHTSHFMRAEVALTNGTGITISLPLFGFCTLTSDDGTTLQADAFRSDWSESLGPGGKTKGVIIFPGHLPDGARDATLAWSTVFAQGFSGPSSLSIGLSLTAEAEAVPANEIVAQRGDNGDEVREVQTYLVERWGFGALKIDGLFGPKTEQAVQTFQTQHNLEATGRVDQRTYSALKGG